MSNISLRPALGQQPGRSPRGAILLICHYALESISTIYDSIRSLQSFSEFAIEVMNVWPVDLLDRPFPPSLDLGRFVGIAIHNTISYHPPVLRKIDRFIPGGLRAFPGVKILFRQDEHHHTNAFRDFVLDAGIDIVLTCLSESDVATVYGDRAAHSAVWVRAFTAYVTDQMLRLPNTPYAQRKYDITYRGSYQPLFCGRLGYEKWSIGERIARHPDSRNLRLNISSRWEDRISQYRWFEFLLDSRATLGVESGSNLFDLDGEVEKLCVEFAGAHPDLDQRSKAFYDLAESEFLHSYEGNVNYGQLGPRHIEAVATRTLLILYEGGYSGLLEPHLHYFPLKRDLSNFGEAAALLADPDRVGAITEAAREHLFGIDELSYKAFVRKLDGIVAAAIAKKRVPSAPAVGSLRRTLILCNHDPKTDPRIGWIRSWFGAGDEICEIGACAADPGASFPFVERLDDSAHRVCIDRRLHAGVWKPRGVDDIGSAGVGSRTLAQLEIYADSSPVELACLLGAHLADDRGYFRFRSRCRYFVDANTSLMQAALDLGRFDRIVAADLETLPAAVSLKQLWSCSLIYDAHEHWPSAFPDMQQWEQEWWAQVEGRLAPAADLRLTVSPQLAEFMSAEYGAPFISAPNAVPRADAPDLTHLSVGGRDRSNVVFLFLGGFGAERGLELLIDVWPSVPGECVLHLRGPHGAYRQQLIKRAKANGAYGSRILFPEPVTESELIRCAMSADVGIIPYEPVSINNRWCCPNKLSQYMAAGLPLLANRTEFVASVVTADDIGKVADFKDAKALAATINDMARDAKWRKEAGRRSRKCFEQSFNWEQQSRTARDRTLKLLAACDPAAAPLDFARLLADKALRPQPPIRWGLQSTTRSALKSVWRTMPQSVRYKIISTLNR